jgi:hypothetical protein
VCGRVYANKSDSYALMLEFLRRLRCRPHGAKGARRVLVLSGFSFCVAVKCLLMLYPFLAVPTSRVDADILVVEGWVWDNALDAAIAEFRSGRYQLVIVAGMQDAIFADDDLQYSNAQRTAQRLVALGLDSSRVIVSAGQASETNRTAGSARAVREKLTELDIHPKGVNVISIGVHARQTWLAYRRIMSKTAPVGIITVPSLGIDPERWWLQKRAWRGAVWRFAHWFREWLSGPRE